MSAARQPPLSGGPRSAKLDRRGSVGAADTNEGEWVAFISHCKGGAFIDAGIRGVVERMQASPDELETMIGQELYV